jgi:4-amino-4-deoxy-L-arabinose transferase-like glycosyltransferase
MEERPSSAPLLTLLLVAALPVFFIFLDANSIWDANEAFYVETPRQMVLSGDYITPVFNDAPRVNKPVLSYWIVAGLYKVFGISVGVERFGIALGAVGIILAAFLIGRALRSHATGLVAALVVATAPRMVMFSRRIFIDIYITLFMALALACFVLAERHPEQRRRWLLAMYVAMGLGVLTKGPVAIVIPVVVLALWLTLERRWSDIRRLLLVPGLLIIAAIVVPWYAVLTARHGWEPLTTFLLGENLERFTTAMASDDRSVWYYLPVVFGDLFPWAPLLVVPAVSAWRRARAGEDATHAAIRRLLWLWIVVFVAIFSLSQTKQDLYIFPVAPAVAALVADALVASGFGSEHRGLRIMLGVVAVLCLACSPLVFWVFGSGYYALPGARAAAVLLGIGALVMLGGVVSGRARVAVLAMAATFVTFNYVFVSRVLPGMERLKPVVPLADVLATRATSSSRLGSYHLMLPSLVYYARRPVQILDDQAEALEFYRDPRDGWAIMTETEFEELRALLPGLCVASRHPLFDAKPRNFLNQQPPADVLLVTNRCGG